MDSAACAQERASVNAPLRPCTSPGCPRLTTRSQGAKCDDCRRVAEERDRERRGSSAQRGYDAQWRAVRAVFLQEHPLCERHQAKGLVVPATVANHRVTIAADPSRRLDTGNLEALCAPCHDEIVTEGDFGQVSTQG